MGTWRALLHPAHVKRSRGKLNLVPPKVHQLRGSQAVPVGHKGHRDVPVSPTVLPGRVHQPLDLALGKVLAGAQLAVGETLGGNCSIYGGWRDQPEVPFGHALCVPCADYCSYNVSLSNSMSTASRLSKSTGPSGIANAQRTPWVPISKIPVKLTNRGMTVIGVTQLL